MIQAMTAAVSRAYDGPAGRFWDLVGDLIDCVLPVAIAAWIVWTMIAVGIGYVQ